MGPVNGKIYLDQEKLIRTPDLRNDEYLGGMGQFYFKQMNKYKANVAQIDAVTGKQETYGELLNRSCKTAIAMKQKGIKEKDIVTFCSHNHMDVCVPYIATFMLGAIPTAVDPSMTFDEMIYLLNLVKPKMIFVVPEAVGLMESALKTVNLQPEIIVFGKDFFNFFESVVNEEMFAPYELKCSKETAVILFSSGTTGSPKGICLNHYAFLNILDNQVKKVDLSVALSYSTFCWITATSLLTATMFQGNARLIVKEFDPQQFWSYVDKYKVTFIFINPVATQTIAQSTIPEGITTNSLKQYITAGEFTSPALLQRIRKHFPEAAVCQIYGLTETTGFITSFCFKDAGDGRLMEIKPASCGKPMPGFEYKVVDVESGKRLGPNVEGELRVRSKYLMNGYYNTDSSKTFDEEGFLKTGDLVYYDEEFCFYIVDRIKEMCKFNGWQITPQDIERVLLNHPAVNAAAVIGIPAELGGELATACVILKKNCSCTEGELQMFVDEKIDYKKKLRGGVKFVDSFPRTATGKVNRRLLKLLYTKP